MDLNTLLKSVDLTSIPGLQGLDLSNIDINALLAKNNIPLDFKIKNAGPGKFQVTLDSAYLPQTIGGLPVGDGQFKFTIDNENFQGAGELNFDEDKAGAKIIGLPGAEGPAIPFKSNFNLDITPKAPAQPVVYAAAQPVAYAAQPIAYAAQPIQYYG